MPSSKWVHQTTNPLKGYKDFEFDPTTGFPICPQSRELIDGTRLYCRSCYTFGHSQRSFTGCEKHKEFFAEKGESNNDNKKE